MESTTIAVDLAKSVFQIAVSKSPGKVSESRRLTRQQLATFFARRKPALVLMEACGSSHFWARTLRGYGHEVLLLPPSEVRRYVTRDKTDRTDAKALLEAHRNEEIRSVPVKSAAQQSIVALHRVRSAWMGDRTARLNLIRGILREFGQVLPPGARQVVPQALTVLEDSALEVSEPLRLALREACQEVRALERRIRDVEKQLEALAAESSVFGCLSSVPGIGLLGGTALEAKVGDIRRFATSRHFASFLGLPPKEHSSGLRRRLGAMSKRGDVYLRTLLIHGARAVLAAAKRKRHPDALSRWALAVEKRRGHNVATVALAHKIARLAWAVWQRNTPYRAGGVAAGEV